MIGGFIENGRGAEKHRAGQAWRGDAHRDELTHVDERGDVRMVDVSEKATTRRIAIAEGTILMRPETQAMVLEDRAKKGDVLACARVAGIMASKRTSDLIPMCHPLMITKAKVDIEPIAAPAGGAFPMRGTADAPAPGAAPTPDAVVPEGWAPPRPDGRVGFHVRATCGVTGVTGIEMEALTAASVACLTIYDMCKAVDRGMEIVDVRLLRKEGGRSGLWERASAADAAPDATDAPSAVDAPGAADAPDAADALAGAATVLEGALAAMEPAHESPHPPAPWPRNHRYQNLRKIDARREARRCPPRRGCAWAFVTSCGHAGFDIDVPGKDSWRHARAGSRHVGLISADRYAEYADTAAELPLEELLSALYRRRRGARRGLHKAAGLPNIVVARAGVNGLRGRDSRDLLDDGTVAVACDEAFAGLVAGAPAIDINDEESVADAVVRFLG